MAQQEWSATTSWADTVNTLDTVVSIATALPTLIPLDCGLCQPPKTAHPQSATLHR